MYSYTRKKEENTHWYACTYNQYNIVVSYDFRNSLSVVLAQSFNASLLISYWIACSAIERVSEWEWTERTSRNVRNGISLGRKIWNLMFSSRMRGNYIKNVEKSVIACRQERVVFNVSGFCLNILLYFIICARRRINDV